MPNPTDKTQLNPKAVEARTGLPAKVVQPAGARPAGPAGLAERTYRQVLASHYAHLGQVLDITVPDKHENANGLDAHLLILSGKNVISVLGDNKHANKPTKSGGSKVVSGRISSFEVAARTNYLNVRREIHQAYLDKRIPRGVAKALIEQAYSGLVWFNVGVSGYNMEVAQATANRYGASILRLDNFAAAMEHRERLDLKRALSGIPSIATRPIANTVRRFRASPAAKGSAMMVLAGWILGKASEATASKAYRTAAEEEAAKQVKIDEYRFLYPDQGILLANLFEEIRPTEGAVLTYFRYQAIQFGGATQEEAVERYIRSPKIEKVPVGRTFTEYAWYPPLLGE